MTEDDEPPRNRHGYSKFNLSKTTPRGRNARLELAVMLKEIRKSTRIGKREAYIPRNYEAEFCPLIYTCGGKKKRKADRNCFLKKAPGCEEFIQYLEEQNPGAEITSKNCLEYYTPIKSEIENPPKDLSQKIA
jgi:hypothetical protein